MKHWHICNLIFSLNHFICLCPQTDRYLKGSNWHLLNIKSWSGYLKSNAGSITSQLCELSLFPCNANINSVLFIRFQLTLKQLIHVKDLEIARHIVGVQYTFVDNFKNIHIYFYFDPFLLEIFILMLVPLVLASFKITFSFFTRCLSFIIITTLMITIARFIGPYLTAFASITSFTVWLEESRILNIPCSTFMIFSPSHLSSVGCVRLVLSKQLRSFPTAYSWLFF